MPRPRTALIALCLGLVWFALGTFGLRADDTADLREELRQLRQQNADFQKQLQQQQRIIDELSHKVGEIQEAKPPMVAQTATANPGEDIAIPTSSPSLLGKVSIGGEGGVAFFHTGSEGGFPNGEFRLDEARLFVEAPVYDSVYFYGELNLATREEPDVEARLGELYVDIENVSRLWNAEQQLNVRAGRMFIPFGEEYQTRYAIDDPLISHSVSDLWGVDEGLELYGRAGKISYVAAVQNGGIPDTRDFTPDKSLAGRIGFDPSQKVHVSISGMRTGEIDVRQDQLSAMWFGNGFFRSVGSAAATRFQAELIEGDVQFKLAHGHIGAFGGYIHYHDNDPTANNARDMYYYSVEGVHDIFGNLYGAARFSQVLAPDGYPIVGNGGFGDYFFGPLTTDLWRLSLDLGYRWSQNFLLKAEYSFERGKTADGNSRNDEDLFAVEAAFRF